MQAVDEALPPKRRRAMLIRTLRALVRAPAARTSPPLTAAHLPPLRGRTEIVRDGHGVPHIYAEREPDLFAILGYLQAADRFVLLDVIRHLGAGRLCELVGDFAAPGKNERIAGRRVRDIDAFVRPLDFEAQCARDATRLGPRARACIDAFATGMNAALRAMRGVYPPEYLLFGRVRSWQPSDCLLAARTCAFVVSLTAFENELTFDAVRGQLGDAAARRLYPEAPWHDVPVSYLPQPGPTPEPPIHLPAGGSNNWAVGCERAANGAPIVANDPHVPLVPLPTFWYHAHLECPQYRVQGGLLPGCPVFGFGHNGFLAWGVTTGYRDGWDVYRIHRLAADPTRYRTGEGSAAITSHCELRYARAGRSVPLRWESCAHGILYPGWRHHDGTELAVRHVAADLASYFEGYLALAGATTVDEHRAALAQINEGPFDFNHVYGHGDGHIGWEVFGRLPQRRADGLFVRDADDPAAQWHGFVPFADMPKILNPARGFVASANAIVDPDDYARIATAVHFEPRWRQERIEQVLGASTVHSTESCAALQRDVHAAYALALRDVLVRDVVSHQPSVPGLAMARQLMAEWDGDFTADSGAAALFFFTQQELARRAFMALLGRPLGMRYANGRHVRRRLHRLLLDAADPLRADIERSSGRSMSQLVGEAFAVAVQRVISRCGAAPERWRWGTIQRARLGTLLSVLPGVGRHFVALDADFPGDEYTVSPSRAIGLGRQLYAFVGASSRFICDLAHPEEALFAHSSGPSGDIASVFFKNLSAPWQRFEYFRSALWPADAVPNSVERVVVGV